MYFCKAEQTLLPQISNDDALHIIVFVNVVFASIR